MGFLYPENHPGKEEEKMVKVRINGRTYSLSMEEFFKMLRGRNLVENPVEVLHMKGASA